jgi:two-component system cell cycle sensor histidine kinase/response regulator CckA
VLLVEDEPFVRDATCRTLENAGFEVLPVGDAREAMQTYEHRHGKIDLLMTDMTLPGRSGRQLSHDLRVSSAEIPVLLTSGYIENDWERQAREPRMYFLPKPYTRAELVQALEKIFGSAVQRKTATQAS